MFIHNVIIKFYHESLYNEEGKNNKKKKKKKLINGFPKGMPQESTFLATESWTYFVKLNAIIMYNNML